MKTDEDANARYIEELEETLQIAIEAGDTSAEAQIAQQIDDLVNEG